jgi:hypothetical protein
MAGVSIMPAARLMLPMVNRLTGWVTAIHSLGRCVALVAGANVHTVIGRVDILPVSIPPGSITNLPQ